MDPISAIMISMISAATPLIFAALGELITERSGVLNLGVEGMMLMGAVVGFVSAVLTGNLLFATLLAMAAGMLMALVFGFLVLTVLSNQVATGLALTIFGVGLSALIGQNFVGIPLAGLADYSIPFFSDLPIVGAILFRHDLLVYFAVFMVIAVTFFLFKTRAGLILRAVGDNHDAAHALGHPVIKIRYMAVMFGGAMAGLGGAYLSLAYTPLWVENMTAGRGWIALSLVVFASWRPLRLALGAYLFGGVSIAQLHVQSFGIDIASQFLSMLPYLATILVLVIISRDQVKIRMNAPATIGKSFHPTL